MTSIKKSANPKKKAAIKNLKNKPKGIDLYFKKIFGLMFCAVGVTAIATFLTIYAGGINLLVGQTGLSFLYYIVVFGGLGLAIWAQVKAFTLKPVVAGGVLFLYAALMGFVITPLVWFAIAVNPASILMAFIIAALMFGCMALFGYKTTKNLSFMGKFLFMGMIGLILVGVFSMFWGLGSGFATLVCIIGVLVFAGFTAYDMQQLKNMYESVSGDETRTNQLAVLGALHLYIAFIAMFQYILSLLNRN